MNFPQIEDLTNAEQYAKAVDMPFDNGRDGELEPGQMYVCNDSRFNQSTYNQPLTDYAVGGWAQTGLDEELRAYVGQPIQSPRRFNYKVWSNDEAFRSEIADDARAIGADFKAVNLTNTEVNTRIQNRGLIYILDADELKDGVYTEQMVVGYLMQRLKINQIRRASALLIAAATNTGKVWLSTFTKDPDTEELTEVHASQTATGIWPNTVIYGKTAWLGRLMQLRAQATAGSFAGAAQTPGELAGLLGVENVFRVATVWQSAKATKTVIGASIVLTFTRENNAMQMDPSNIRMFWSPTDSGGPISAFRYQPSQKKIVVGVECNELIAITYTGGIRTLTIT